MRCEHCGGELVEVDNPMRREFRHRRGVVCSGMPRPPAVVHAPGSTAETGSTGVPEPEDSAQASEEWQVRITAPDGTGVVIPADSLTTVHATAAQWRASVADSEVPYLVEAERREVGAWEIAPPLPVPSTEEETR